MFDKGSFHWYIQRSSALFLFFGFSLSIFFNLVNVFFLSLFLIVLVFHIEMGIETFICDYMHDPFSIFVSEVFLDLFVIFGIKSVFLLLLFL
uniref:Succinate:cytochrome c oxidoreductase subunit 4 n=1 Tax=Rhodomonas salina TaxID=3034 RepID=Q9G8V5_RHDSA|nr:succinate:cytochrome c oxidoreductase subunit 4 [Rhodomonas salina]AAG17742.1 succinate:cytochrome c oxidoreductase subunit 4 [Rhodomonas salina]